MAPKNQYVQKISKAICKESPDIEEVLLVVCQVCEEAANRHRGTPLGEAYQKAHTRIGSTWHIVRTQLFNGVFGGVDQS